MSSVRAHREFYAKLIVREQGALGDALVRAFSVVPREQYSGPGPWQIFSPWRSYLESPTDDPRFLYQDVLVALSREQGINNGSPGLHARMLAAAAPARGETVVQVGVGTGYYSAVLAELVGPEGTVHAYEIDPELAAVATENLSAYPQVEVRNASATEGTLPTANVVYVSAGATHPVDLWLDALAVGGRLIFPLTDAAGGGAMTRIERLEGERYTARFVCPASFIDCVGARDAAAARALSAALEGSRPPAVSSLWRNDDPDDTAWCVGEGWWLSTRSVELS